MVSRTLLELVRHSKPYSQLKLMQMKCFFKCTAKVQNFLPFCKLFREKVSIFCAFIFSSFSMGSPLVSPLVSPATEDSPSRAPFYRPFPPILGSPEPFLQSRHSFILFTANKYIVPKTKIRPKDTNFTLKKQIFEPFFTFESKNFRIIKNTMVGSQPFFSQTKHQGQETSLAGGKRKRGGEGRLSC